MYKCCCLDLADMYNYIKMVLKHTYTRYYQKTSRTPMNSLNLQDTKLIHRNLLHSYTQKMKDQKDKLWKQSHLLWHKKNNKILRNKPK